MWFAFSSPTIIKQPETSQILSVLNDIWQALLKPACEIIQYSDFPLELRYSMHELSITESILEIALRHAGQAKARRIIGLHLVIGQLASIVDDSVQFYWDIISAGTLAEGARLNFRRIPAELLCLDCQHRYPVDGQNLVCPVCQSTHVKVAAGTEFSLEAIDIE